MANKTDIQEYLQVSAIGESDSPMAKIIDAVRAKSNPDSIMDSLRSLRPTETALSKLTLTDLGKCVRKDKEGNLHPSKEVESLRADFATNGYLETGSIVAWDNPSTKRLEVVSGNQRVYALKLMGREKALCTILPKDFPQDVVVRLRQALNNQTSAKQRNSGSALLLRIEDAEKARKRLKFSGDKAIGEALVAMGMCDNTSQASNWHILYRHKSVLWSYLQEEKLSASKALQIIRECGKNPTNAQVQKEVDFYFAQGKKTRAEVQKKSERETIRLEVSKHIQAEVLSKTEDSEIAEWCKHTALQAYDLGVLSVKSLSAVKAEISDRETAEEDLPDSLSVEDLPED